MQQGLTRAAASLLAVLGAGALIWAATQVNTRTTGGYWAAYTIIVAAGFTLALSRVVWIPSQRTAAPRLARVFLLLLPVLVATGWIMLADQPNPNSGRDYVLSWTAHMHLRGLVGDLRGYLGALAVGFGVLIGLIFELPRPRGRPRDAVPAQAREPLSGEAAVADQPTARERTEVPGSAADRERIVEHEQETDSPALPAAGGGAARLPTAVTEP